MAEPFRFERSARGPHALVLIGLSAAFLCLLVFVIEAAWWIAAFVALVTAPSVVEAIRGDRSTLALDDDAIAWTSGRRSLSVPLARIEEARLATTLDFSQRASLRLTSGEKLRIPPECLPGGRLLDAALAARGVAHHRSLFGF